MCLLGILIEKCRGVSSARLSALCLPAVTEGEQVEVFREACWDASRLKVVDVAGIEPATPCLQRSFGQFALDGTRLDPLVCL